MKWTWPLQSGYLYIAGTIGLTVYGQLVIKWQSLIQSNQSGASSGKMGYLFAMLSNPWVISSLLAAVLASFCWMLAVARFPLSVAYPYMSLSFAGVIVLSACFFGETFTPSKALGLLLLGCGIYFLGR
ncbi:MAG: EamA family transporter [Candidatus Sericytochromatia bacterium]|nr:EamA family transporter [Candidatus Sericytochromatia bacterium]